MLGGLEIVYTLPLVLIVHCVSAKKRFKDTKVMTEYGRIFHANAGSLHEAGRTGRRKAAGRQRCQSRGLANAGDWIYCMDPVTIDDELFHVLTGACFGIEMTCSRSDS